MDFELVLRFVRAIGAVTGACRRLGAWLASTLNVALIVIQCAPLLVFLLILVLYFCPSLFSSVTYIFDLMMWYRYNKVENLQAHAPPVVAAPPPVVTLVENDNSFWVLMLLAAFMFLLLVVAFLVAMVRWSLSRPVRIVRKPYCDSDFVVERSVEGSTFFNTGIPAFQAVVYIMLDGKWYRAGGCFRMADGVMTCWHVIAGAERIRLVRGENSIELEPDSFEHLERLGDVALYRGGVNLLWLKQAKISRVALSQKDKQMVMIHNGEMASIGPLSGHSSFGMVTYAGSTAKGFSGSPYYMGNVVYGLHFGAQAVNMGYEAAYLALLLAQESSDDYYLDLIAAGHFHESSPSKYDPAEVNVKINDEYIVVAKRDYEEAKHRKRHVRESMPRPPVVDFRDSENYEQAAVPPRTAGLNSKGGAAALNTGAPISSETAFQCLEPGCPPVMPHPEPTRVPKGLVSSDTSLTHESLRQQLENLLQKAEVGVGNASRTRRRRLRDREQLRQLRTATSAPGAPTFTDGR